MSNKSRSRTGRGTVYAALVIAVVFGGLLTYAGSTGAFSGIGIGGTAKVTTTTMTITGLQASSTANGAPGSLQASCSQNSIKGQLSNYQGQVTGSTGAPTINRFLQSSGGLTQVIDNPGANNWATVYGPSAQTYTLNYIDQFTATNSYPEWVNLATVGANNPQTEFGVITYNVSCQLPAGGSNNALTWVEAAQLFAAPTSGLSSSFNVEATVQYPSSSAPTAMPTVQQTWNFILQIFGTNTAGLVPTTAYGTVANPIQNYANGGSVTNSGPVTVGGVFILAANATNVQVSAPGAISITPLGGTASRAWIVPITQGCPPSPSSTTSGNPYNCSVIPVQIYETSTLSHHTEVVGMFTDMQQSAYIVGNFATPAVTAWPTASAGGYSSPCGSTFATAGTCPASGQGTTSSNQFTFGTPVTGNNIGNPSPLIAQSVAIKLSN